MEKFWTKASEKMPIEDGEYLIVINSTVGEYVELCNYSKKGNCFTCYDYYNDGVLYYKQKDINYWMKIPEYKNLEK